MNEPITLTRVSDLHAIQPLWQQLNAQHLTNSNNFKEHYAEQTFESRFARFFALPPESMHIEAIQAADKVYVGYCICTAQNGEGEIDSIYIEPEYRGRHFGSALISHGIAWLKEKGCGIITVSVADGNEQAFPFYERCGFRVRKTVLQLK